MTEIFYDETVLVYASPIIFTCRDNLTPKVYVCVLDFEAHTDPLTYLVYESDAIPTLDEVSDDIVDCIKRGDFGGYWVTQPQEDSLSVFLLEDSRYVGA